MGSGDPWLIGLALRLTAALLFVVDGLALGLFLERLFGIRFRSGLAIWIGITSLFLMTPWLRDRFLGAMIPTSHAGIVSGLFLFWTYVAINPVQKKKVWESVLLWAVVTAYGISDAQFLSITAYPFLAFWAGLFAGRFLLKIYGRLAGKRMISDGSF